MEFAARRPPHPRCDPLDGPWVLAAPRRARAATRQAQTEFRPAACAQVS